MFMEHASSGLVRAYALELLVDAVRQRAERRREQPAGSLRKISGRLLRAIGASLVKAGERVDSRRASTLAHGCG